MKKLIAMMTILALLLALTACGSKSESSQPASSEAVSEAVSEPEETTEPESAAQEEPVIGMANPVEAQESLQAVNDAVGCKLVHLAVMGVTDTAYNTINVGEYTIGEYDFEFQGGDWSFRAAPTENDISGIYVSEGVISDCGDEDVTAFEIEGYFYCRWFVEEMQYSLACQHNGEVTLEQFQMAVDEMQNVQNVQ